MACHFRTAVPLGAAYQTYPVDLFNFQTVASPHGRASVGALVPYGGAVEMCLNFELLTKCPKYFY